MNYRSDSVYLCFVYGIFFDIRRIIIERIECVFFLGLVTDTWNIGNYLIFALFTYSLLMSYYFLSI